MPAISLDTADAIELAELLQFIRFHNDFPSRVTTRRRSVRADSVRADLGERRSAQCCGS
jgi:hypothetical protein